MIWLIMIAAGALTFAARFSMIGMFAQRNIPEGIKRVLVYTGPAVLATIIAREVLVVDAATTATIALTDNPRLPAFAVAVIVALITRNVLATIACGMGALWLVMQLGL